MRHIQLFFLLLCLIQSHAFTAGGDWADDIDPQLTIDQTSFLGAHNIHTARNGPKNLGGWLYSKQSESIFDLLMQYGVKAKSCILTVTVQRPRPSAPKTCRCSKDDQKKV